MLRHVQENQKQAVQLRVAEHGNGIRIGCVTVKCEVNHMKMAECERNGERKRCPFAHGAMYNKLTP